jgi:Sec-independent protein secretion pathway component TatC
MIPLSLDSFNAYGEKTLESLWSFTEIFLLEFTLSFLLISFFQFPLFFASWISLEKKIQNLSKWWKLISFFSFLIAGIITPTLDASIQFFLAFISICFYFATVSFLQKRINIKISGFSILS